MYQSNGGKPRGLKTLRIESDFTVVGGGLAGICAALAAARQGIKVTLVQDRPVLGGNASSEVRLWILGATSHMGNNNRWSREGGILDEILIENLYRNREGNPYCLDALLLEKVAAEPNITLLLNTAAHELHMDGERITTVRAFCSQNSMEYELISPLFCDASGDGVVGFLAGAAFRMGAEAKAEFGEKFAPEKSYGELLGHSMYFYSRDTGQPVKFVAPAFAIKNVPEAIPRYRQLKTGRNGCELWWIEYGGRLDTVHDTETIKWELWKIVYGVWDYIKNSGKFPEAATHTLEWVSSIPGKRESRRFEGNYLLRQQDVIEQTEHADVVAHGGWSLDLHPADGVYSALPGCNQWHSKGVYGIPYRCYYSRNIKNLFLAGRIISATHVAFASSRVMATCAAGGQAVGTAAALCHKENLLPADWSREPRIRVLQRELSRTGQFLPGIVAKDPADLAQRASVEATSTLELAQLSDDGDMLSLRESWAMLLPLQAGKMPKVSVHLEVEKPTTLAAELRISSKPFNHTPDVTLASLSLPLPAGKSQCVDLDFGVQIDQRRYGFVCLLANPAVSVHTSHKRVTGVVAVANKFNPAVARNGRQMPPGDIGVESFEFWCPQRRPGGQNLAMAIEPPLRGFEAANVLNGVARPVSSPNAWVADPADAHPALTLHWPTQQTIGRIELSFDCDFDHAAESVLRVHSENVMPFCVRRFRVRDAAGALLHECEENHQTRRVIVLDRPVRTDSLRIELEHPSEHTPAALFEVRCYEK